MTTREEKKMKRAMVGGFGFSLRPKFWRTKGAQYYTLQHAANLTKAGELDNAANFLTVSERFGAMHWGGEVGKLGRVQAKFNRAAQRTGWQPQRPAAEEPVVVDPSHDTGMSLPEDDEAQRANQQVATQQGLAPANHAAAQPDPNMVPPEMLQPEHQQQHHNDYNTYDDSLGF